MKKYKRFLHNLILIVLSIVFDLIVLEIGVKIWIGFKESTNTIILTGDEMVYDHRPSFSFVNKHNIKVHYNSLGFIGEEIVDKKEGSVRILGLGDSITEGIYIPPNNNYLSLLEDILNKKYNKNVEVINGAVSGYNSWQQLALLKKKGLTINPDLVVVGLCLNDSVKTIPTKYINLFGRLIALDINDGSKARYLDFLYQRSSLYRLIYNRFSTVSRNIKNKAGYQQYLKDYEFSISFDEWKQWQGPLREINNVCKKNDIKIMFIIFPLHAQLVKNEKFTYEPLIEFMQKYKIDFIDLIEKFKPYYQQKKPIYRSRDIIHPNILGHRIIAEVLAEYLIKNNILG